MLDAVSIACVMPRNRNLANELKMSKNGETVFTEGNHLAGHVPPPVRLADKAAWFGNNDFSVAEQGQQQLRTQVAVLRAHRLMYELRDDVSHCAAVLSLTTKPWHRKRTRTTW